MMRSSAYNRLGVLMGTSSPASDPRCLSLRGDSLPMIPLISSQGDFCATAGTHSFASYDDDDCLALPRWRSPATTCRQETSGLVQDAARTPSLRSHQST